MGTSKVKPTSDRAWVTVGGHRDGRAIEIPVATVHGSADGPRVVLVAGVHGDEVQGIQAARDVIDRIDPTDVHGTLTVLPLANPGAYEAALRRSPADQLDLNRTFPGNPSGSPTERLADAIWTIARECDVVISLHSWYVFGSVHPYVEYPRGRTQVDLASLAIARASGLGFLRASDWHPGLLVATANRSGIRAVELEIGGLGRVTAEGRRQYIDALDGILRFVGSVQTKTRSHSTRPNDAALVRHSFVLASAGGFFARAVEIGERVVAGQLMGELTDAFGRRVERVRADADAIVAGCREHPAVQAGDQLLYLFHLEPTSDGDLTGG